MVSLYGTFISTSSSSTWTMLVAYSGTSLVDGRVWAAGKPDDNNSINGDGMTSTGTVSTTTPSWVHLKCAPCWRDMWTGRNRRATW